MIVYPAGLVLSASVPLRNPRIGHQTYTAALAAAAVTASSDAVATPKDAPLRPDTAEYWQPSALPATWLVDLGANKDLDYVGIAGHSIGSLGLSVGVAAGTTTDFAARLSLPGSALNASTTPDSVANSVLGDIDIRAKASALDWTPAAIQILAAKDNVGAQRSYGFYLKTNGTLEFFYTTDGSTVAGRVATSSVAPTFLDGTINWVRVTYVSATGVVTFYTSLDGVTWTPLGTTVALTSGAIFNSTVVLGVGCDSNIANTWAGSIYYLDIRNVIGGAPVVKFDPSSGVTDGTSFTSSTGEVWTINVNGGTPARLINPRFGGTADILPANDSPIMFLDTKGLARYVQITISGTSAAMPKLAVVYAGVTLAMMEEIDGRGFMPASLSRSTLLQKSLSRGGQFLGQGARRNGVMSTWSFKLLESLWYRANFDPFVKNARYYPYFTAWNPQAYPQDVAYVWSEKDIVGRYTGNGPWVEVSWSMQGIGSD